LAYNPYVNIDLHIHSTASDGTLSPAEILKFAEDFHLGAFAVTDHDTIKGSQEILRLKRSRKVQFLTGIEISVSPLSFFQEPGTFHILGYGIDVNDRALNENLDLLKSARENRNPKIIQRLNELGIPLTVEIIMEDVGQTDQLGRPHIARSMVKRGYASSIDDAFQTYLAAGKPAYVDKFRLECKKAIEIIRNARGIPVIAHPFLLKLKKGVDLEAFILALRSIGLMGIEAYYPDHTFEQTARYIEIAKRHEMLITGGTDFHGALNPEIQIGSGTGNFSVPYALFEKLAAVI